MRQRLSPGIYALVLVFIAGVWLAASPFVLQTQPSGGAWIPATINAVASGGVLVVASLVGIGTYSLLAVNSAIRAEVIRARTAERHRHSARTTAE